MIRKITSTLFAAIALFTVNAANAATTGPFNVQVLLPGMTKTIKLSQQQTLPLGCPQFFILTIGNGFLGISVKKDDVVGDAIFMTGFVSAGGKVTPVQRVGISTGMIDQIVEIDGDASTLGFVWLWCGVAYSQNVPMYASQLRLSLQP